MLKRNEQISIKLQKVENSTREKPKERSKEIVKEKSEMQEMENKDSIERTTGYIHHFFENPN